MKEEQSKTDMTLPVFVGGSILVLGIRNFFESLSMADKTLFFAAIGAIGTLGAIYLWDYKSKARREDRKRIEEVKNIPLELRTPSPTSIYVGEDHDLKLKLYLSDAIRARHVHIIGATGSGKTESVIYNFLRQDVERGLGAIILDAKGDASFLSYLRKCVPEDRLRIFDLGNPESLTYNPVEVGSPLEAAQRLFSSLNWSEEYYKSKAFSSLQKLFQNHFEINKCNPNLKQLSDYLDSPDTYTPFVMGEDYPQDLAKQDFKELSGLRDQVKSLSIGYLDKTLSPKGGSAIRLDEAASGKVIYFRLQSLMSPQLVAILGKLIINHLNYLAGTAHRGDEKGQAKGRKLIPTYLDEFASFACPEFAELISKARSAGLALHFSHQSVGDVMDVSPGFINRITDNSATKIVMRINDPDSAEFFARSFGTKQYQKVTQRITNTKEIVDAEIIGEGSSRDARQFRASPDLFKTLPTGVGSILVAHGQNIANTGASAVFKISFPAPKMSGAGLL